MLAEPVQKKPVIEVEDYYDKVHQYSWSRRSAGVMAGATLGVGFGAIIGAVAAFFPYILGAIGVAGATAVAAPTIGAIATSAAMLAGVAGLMGIAVVSTIGADAGAAAGAVAEKEKREKLDKFKEDGVLGASANPDMRIQETPGKMPPPFNWRTAIFTVPLFATFGALIGMNPVTAPLLISAQVGGLGLTAGSAAAVAASTGVMSMFGVLFAMPQSYYSNKVSNFYWKVLKDKIFTGHAPTNEVAVQPLSQTEKTATFDMPAFSEPSRNKRFATETTRFSLQGIVEKTEDHSADLTLTR